MFRVIFTGLLFLSLVVKAQEDSSLEDRAKNRLYPGGVDEQALQVQESLSYPVSAVNLANIQESVLNEDDNNEEENQTESSSSQTP